MTYLDTADALACQGSLISENGSIVAPYDLENHLHDGRRFKPLSSDRRILNAAIEPFRLTHEGTDTLHIVNGMGVTLGDSIIGLTALYMIKCMNPQRRLVIYRPESAPDYVEQLYAIASGLIADCVKLPVNIGDLPLDKLCIDIGNHLFWDGFASMPMIDFFLWALGIDPRRVSSDAKANKWLGRLDLALPPSEWMREPYVLFCPTASTPVRSIPSFAHASLVDKLWKIYGKNIVGFGKINHDHYINIQDVTRDTSSFLSWIKYADFVLTCDTAAVHAAAGFSIPTVAFFTTISPSLRVRDYRECTAVALDLSDLKDIQASSREKDLALVESAFRSINIDDICWPVLRN